MDSRVISGVGVAVGIALAMPLVLLEESGFDRRMRRLPFSMALLATALAYAGSIAAVFMSTSLVTGYLERPDRSATIGRPRSVPASFGSSSRASSSTW
jgi:uncharacterized oligopeptide transporter (OPT) family protein